MGRDRENKSVFLQLVQFPNSCKGQSWAGLNLGIRGFFWGQGPKHLGHPLLLSQAFNSGSWIANGSAGTKVFTEYLHRPTSEEIEAFLICGHFSLK